VYLCVYTLGAHYRRKGRRSYDRTTTTAATATTTPRRSRWARTVRNGRRQYGARRLSCPSACSPLPPPTPPRPPAATPTPPTPAPRNAPSRFNLCCAAHSLSLSLSSSLYLSIYLSRTTCRRLASSLFMPRCLKRALLFSLSLSLSLFLSRANSISAVADPSVCCPFSMNFHSVSRSLSLFTALPPSS